MQNNTETYTATLETTEYIIRFRDVEKIQGYCKICRNYNKNWACPPFNFDMDNLLLSFKMVLITATKIMPEEKEIPFSKSGQLIIPERKRIQKQLLKMEMQYNGRSFAYAGTCLYCPEGICTRAEDKPCLHPELVRPSLEAFGFDIGRTTSELFGIDLKWSINGCLPEYLTLVCGFFYNSDTAIILKE